jgi:glutathione peroxidase
MSSRLRNLATLGLFFLSSCGLNQRKLEPIAAQGQGSSILNHQVTRIDGRSESLADYRGKALLIVNTASKCGFTKQYDGLEELHRRYATRGLVVMGFPCNDFMGQEPGSNEEILEFCRSSFQVDFPLFAKLTVQGDSIHPLYKTLTTEVAQSLRGPIKWNFTKFLVDTQGHVVGRFEPRVDPLDPELLKAIEGVLPPK